MHIVGYLYEDYHDARSLEHKISETSKQNRTRIAQEQTRLARLGRRWGDIFQIDLTEIEYEILNLMQVVRMGSSGGLRFEHDKEYSCIIKGRTFSPFEITGRSWDYVNVNVVRCQDLRSFCTHPVTDRKLLGLQSLCIKQSLCSFSYHHYYWIRRFFKIFPMTELYETKWLLVLTGPIVCMHYSHCLFTRAAFMLCYKSDYHMLGRSRKCKGYL
jgi:hypothetical protein